VWSSTLEPTLSPTDEPSALPTPGSLYYIVRGSQDVECRDNDYPTCGTIAVDMEERHAVRCCSDADLGGGWTKNSGCEVWAESEVPGCYGAPYSVAVQICKQSQARLCSRTELESGCTAKTGCDFDYVMVWSSTLEPTLSPTDEPSAPPTPYYIVRGSQDVECRDNDYPTCGTIAVDMEERHAVRCCSDADLGGGWTKNSGCEVWAESEVPGCYGAPYSVAVQICERSQARLCSRTELESGCTAVTGCGFDQVMVWSLTPGTPTDN